MSSEKMEGDQIRTGHKIGVRKCKIYQIRCTKEKQNRKKKKKEALAQTGKPNIRM
jgi:hypothetical protein